MISVPAPSAAGRRIVRHGFLPVSEHLSGDLAQTRIHEYAHALLHFDVDDDTERAKREVEAEAVAYHEYLRYAVLKLLEEGPSDPDSTLPRIDDLTVGYGQDTAMFESWHTDVEW